jgi:phosphatidylglycerophosphate synthase
VSNSRARTANQQRDSYRAALQRLAAAQKPPARSSPAYSRYVNRRIGRYLAAASYRAGLTPNAVTAVSAVITFASIALLVIFPPSWGLGIAVALGLLLGYAFDSADGQVSRLTGRSSPAGEWLDHMVDSTKASAMPIALAVGFYRFEVVPVVWLLVPLGFAVVSAVLFFSMILTEQLRRQRGVVSLASETPGRMPSWLRALAVAPMDYGVLCLTFVLLGALPVFLGVYTVIFAATTLFLALSSAKWFLELRSMPTNAAPAVTSPGAVNPTGPNHTAPNRTVTP